VIQNGFLDILLTLYNDTNLLVEVVGILIVFADLRASGMFSAVKMKAPVSCSHISKRLLPFCSIASSTREHGWIAVMLRCCRHFGVQVG
jgi:hypothetical protein